MIVPDVPGLDAPSPWLLTHVDLLPSGAAVLDVAAGRGRHALPLAASGFRVHAVDGDEEKLAALAADAARLGLEVETTVMDLETGAADLGEARYGAVVVFNYLHRPLMPALIRAIAPGGVLVYETFTITQAERGKPTNPDFLLNPGELIALIAPLQVLRSREGDYDGKSLASVIAVAPSAGGALEAGG